ncbi:MAG: RNA polymerase factor sigma-54 [Bacteroidales bacterium]|nr:RNA polymerase factor sigma-54 [Bacteroidales bacterium]
MSLKQQQKLVQKLSPQQIQILKLIQIPAIALEQRIKQEIEENPALEEVSFDVDNNTDADYDYSSSIDESLDREDSNDEAADEYDQESREDFNDNEIDISSYFDEEDDIPLYKRQTYSSIEDNEKTIPFRSETNFHDILYEQLHTHSLTEDEILIGDYVLGSIDENGYLKRDSKSIAMDLAFYYNLQVTPEEVEKMISLIQTFDPPGIGARDLRECLLIQLRRKPQKTPAIKLAIDIIQDHFEDFTKKHYEKLQHKLNVSENQFKEALDEILKLNPKPGNSTSEGRASYSIYPDFTIITDDDEIQVVVNTRNLPELSVSKYYQHLYEEYSKKKKSDPKTQELVQFIKQKLDSAKWFIDALKQRNDTLQTVMEAIVDFQREYFLTGDETKIKPMILKDIAEKTNMDISTISRVASSKYVQTPFGTFLLKSLFSESLENEQGEEVSTREIKSVLKKIIEEENKRDPYTDEELVKILKEKGYNLARRTVAKYREQLGIPVARLRKEI